jgi:hypothetical protein
VFAVFALSADGRERRGVLEGQHRGKEGAAANVVKGESRAFTPGSREHVLARVEQFIASFLRVKAYYEPHTLCSVTSWVES